MGILTLAIQGIQAENALLLTPEFATEMGVLNSLRPVVPMDLEICLIKS